MPLTREASRGRPVRVLMVAQPLDGGVPRHVGDLAESLDPGRFSVEVACPAESLLWSRLERVQHIQLRRIDAALGPSASDLRSLSALAPSVAMADIVHAHSAKAGLLVRAIAGVRGRTHRCVFTPHGWSFWSVYGHGRAAVRVIERGAARWCRAIVAVSYAERAAGLAHGIGRPAQYRVIPNGIDLARFNRPREPDGDRVLVVGRLSTGKRPGLVLDAISLVARSRPGVRLDFVGGGPLTSALAQEIAARGLGSRVRLLGERDDVPQLLARADCLVLASDHESLPLSLIEAMAAGVPVIATRVGGVPEIVEPGITGLLVDPGHHVPLAEAVLELLGDQDRATAMGVAGRERARERFGLPGMVAATTTLYGEILGDRFPLRMRGGR